MADTTEDTDSKTPVDQPSSTGGGPPARVDIGKRAVALIIDAVIAVVVGLVPIAGGIAATAYWLLRDGMDLEFMDHRSIGKKVMKLRPVTLDGQPLDMEASIKRNWMFGLGGLTQLFGSPDIKVGRSPGRSDQELCDLGRNRLIHGFFWDLPEQYFLASVDGRLRRPRSGWGACSAAAKSRRKVFNLWLLLDDRWAGDTAQVEPVR